jgi:hypothetical protein
VAGVNLPVFESYQVGSGKIAFLCFKINNVNYLFNMDDVQDGADAHELAGLAKGGQQIKKLKANYGELS